MNKLLFVCILFCQYTFSQSIISNGSFEDNWDRPNEEAQASLLKNWLHFNGSYFPVTYFYFDTIRKKGFPPKSYNQILQQAHSGRGFIGLGIDLVKNKKNQYLMTLLNEKLVADSSYKITMWVSLEDNIRYGINSINCYFLSSEKESINSNTHVQKLTNRNAEFLTDKKQWTCITGIYKAKGDEIFFLIGGTDHLKRKKTRFKWNPVYFIAKHFSYYFIDDVSIESINKPINKRKDHIFPPNDSVEIVNRDSSIKNISRHFFLIFENDSYILNKNNEDILNNINQKIKPTNHITIYGYADTTGSKSYNLSLAEKRAKNVYEYFFSKAIYKENVKYFAIGERYIKDDFISSRRVEIIID